MDNSILRTFKPGKLTSLTYAAVFAIPLPFCFSALGFFLQVNDVFLSSLMGILILALIVGSLFFVNSIISASSHLHVFFWGFEGVNFDTAKRVKVKWKDIVEVNFVEHQIQNHKAASIRVHTRDESGDEQHTDIRINIYKERSKDLYNEIGQYYQHWKQGKLTGSLDVYAQNLIKRDNVFDANFVSVALWLIAVLFMGLSTGTIVLPSKSGPPVHIEGTAANLLMISSVLGLSHLLVTILEFNDKSPKSWILTKNLTYIGAVLCGLTGIILYMY